MAVRISEKIKPVSIMSSWLFHPQNIKIGKTGNKSQMSKEMCISHSVFASRCFLFYILWFKFGKQSTLQGPILNFSVTLFLK